MPYQFQPDENIQHGLVRIAREQLERAIREIEDGAVPPHQTVHQIRKRCKKLRSLLRLVRPVLGGTYRRENARFRDAARTLSGARDSQTMIECLDELRAWFAAEIDPGLGENLRANLLEECRAGVPQDTGLATLLARVHDELHDAHHRAGNWRLKRGGFDALAGGLEKTYARGRSAMAAAYRQPGGARFHQWRKRVKYHRDHQRLLRASWPAVMKRHAAAASELADLLGGEHDLTVLRAAIVEQPQWCGSKREARVLLALIERRQLTLREQAVAPGKRVFAEKPGALVKRLGRYWRATARERQRSTGLGAGAPATE